MKIMKWKMIELFLIIIKQILKYFIIINLIIFDYIL